MNMKIQTDRLEGSGAISNPASPAGRGIGHTATGRAEDSVGLSDLSSQIAERLSAADLRTENRIAELQKLYAQGKYSPDSVALSRSMIARALDSDPGVKA